MADTPRWARYIRVDEVFRLLDDYQMLDAGADKGSRPLVKQEASD